MRKESFKKSAKRWLAVILCLCLIGMMIPVTAMAADASGDFLNGANQFHWELDTNGTLTITITTASTGEDAGAMPDWSFENSPQWDGLKSNIKKVIIGSGVTTIGKDAFLSCINLNEVELNEDLTTIGAAFANCSALTSITIPASVTTIDNNAFKDCSNLGTVNFVEDSALGWIGSLAFYGCTSLASITIPDGVGVIASQAFQGCTSLTSITIPANVHTIGSSAFQGCTDLTTITFAGENPPTTIDSTAFSGCPISTIKVPAEAENYESILTLPGFTNDAQILESIADSNLYWGLYDDGTLTISGTGDMPDWEDESYVPWAIHRSNINNVSIDNRVTSIGNYAFYSCSRLTSITIPASVQTIGDYAFDSCDGLNTVHFAENSELTTIGVMAFNGCTSLTSITIPDSVQTIGNDAFNTCTSLTSITIPDSVQTIGNDAFNTCSVLNTITFAGENPPTTIGDNAFSGCNISTVNVPAGARANYNSILTLPGFTNDAQIVESGGGTSGSGTPIADSNLSWTLDSNGTLTITGTGAMPNWNSNINPAPWYSDRSSIKMVSIEDGVTSIGSDAFRSCQLLRGISLPDSIASIGSYAFNGCNSLEAITLPNNPGFTSIKESTFQGCDNLSSITIPDSVTSIGSYAFYNCHDLNSVELPANLSAIGNAAFQGCNSLTEITIPAGVTEIIAYTFSGCSSLSQVTFLGNVTTIGKSAFWNCSDLNTITFAGTTPPEICNEYGPDFGDEPAFSGCNIRTVYVPAGAENYESILTLPGFTNDAQIVEEGSGTPGSGTPIEGSNLSWTLDSNGTLTITGTGDMPDWDQEEAPWYSNRANIKEVSIVSGVTSIGNSAFYNCSNLTSVELPDSLTEIGNCAFYKCANLTDIAIPASVQTIGYVAFSECTGLTEITIPDSVQTIGSNAFNRCTGLTAVNFGENSELTTIDYCVFLGCTSLNSITIPDSVETIGISAFLDCTGLTTITFAGENPPTTIGDTAFSGSTNIRTIKVPAGARANYNSILTLPGLTNAQIVEEGSGTSGSGTPIAGSNLSWTLDSNGKLTITGTGAMPDWGQMGTPWYSNRENIKKVSIGSGVTSIGNNAFYYCTGLTEVNFAENSELTTIGEYAFGGCCYLTSITIPDGVTTIGCAAFVDCVYLSSVNIPAGVTVISDHMFCQCNLSNITIPAGVTSIESNAFARNNLTEVTFEGTTPPSIYEGFSGCDVRYIWVPARAKANYERILTSTGLTNAQIVELGSGIPIAGSSLNWTLNDGTLTIKGTGAMPDWEDVQSVPWDDNIVDITKVSIGSHVTSIGELAFQSCYNLETVDFAKNSELTTIGASAFIGCTSLTSITIPAGVTEIDSLAFFGCTNLATITFESATPPTTIGDIAFSGCNISTIKVPADATVDTTAAYTDFAESLGLTADAIEEFNPSGSGTPGSISSGTVHEGIGSFSADAMYYNKDTDQMEEDVKHITYGDAAYYALFDVNDNNITDRRMVDNLKIKVKYSQGEDLIDGEPQLVKVCVDGVYQYFIKFNVKQTLDAQLRDVCGTLTLNKSKRDKKDSGDFRVKDLTMDFDFEVGAEFNYADDTRLVIKNDPEIPLWPNEFFIFKYECDEEVEFEFGSDSNEGTFTVDVSGQSKNLITFNTELDENIAAANPDAKMIAISFNNVRFNRSGVFNYEADDMNYAYEIKEGKLVKIAEFANGKVEFKTNTLGRYIFSDVELVSPETIDDAVFVRLT